MLMGMMCVVRRTICLVVGHRWDFLCGRERVQRLPKTRTDLPLMICRRCAAAGIGGTWVIFN